MIEWWPSPLWGLLQRLTCKGGGALDPPAVQTLIDLELRGKNERVARNERKPTASKFRMILGQLVTSEVRSNTQSRADFSHLRTDILQMI